MEINARENRKGQSRKDNP